MSKADPLRVFVGYDSREPNMYRVCRESLLDNASVPVLVTPLKLQKLEHMTLYRRRWYHEDGQFYDVRDGKPFSTEFSFTRFLVPALMMWEGWALFCDADWLWLDDVAALFAMRDRSSAVMVVKHDFAPTADRKMRGQLQTRYYRKLWSSLMLWNCGHPANHMLTPYRVNESSGQWLHAFSWLAADEIGALPETWNWIPGHSPAAQTPQAVHFTAGTPDMPGLSDQAYAAEWLRY